LIYCKEDSIDSQIFINSSNVFQLQHNLLKLKITRVEEEMNRRWISSSLGNFKQLLHLELRSPTKELKSIELPNLQILHLNLCGEITLNTPKLKALYCDCLSSVIVCYPKVIQYLGLTHYNEERDDLTKLTNLQNLVIKPFWPITNIQPFIKLEKLKVLSFIQFGDDEIVEEILERKSENLKVYYRHVEIENVDKYYESNELRSTGG